MIKALQQQLPLLTLNGLRDFAAKQSKYLDEVKRLISGAQSEIARIDKDAQAFMTGGTKRSNNLELRINSSADAAVQVQVADKKAMVRQGLDAQLSPLFKKMLAAKEVAKEYATRHWSKPPGPESRHHRQRRYRGHPAGPRMRRSSRRSARPDYSTSGNWPSTPAMQCWRIRCTAPL